MAEVNTWDTEFEFALEIVKKVGEIIKNAFLRDKVVTEKSSATDLVTETDQEVERVLIKGLENKFPNYRFIGEESVAGGLKCELTHDPTWVIDPIDGTTNFVHSNPHICTILAFMVEQEVEFSIVYNPILDQLWTARRGKGAFYNGAKIQVSSCKSLGSAILVQEVGSATPDRVNMLTTNSTTFIPRVRSIRSYGSAGINLVYLAMGSVDAYFEMGFHIWDYAGPSLIVREAGGVVQDVSGSKIDYLARNILAASTPELIEQIRPNISTITMERD
ncbi:inositol monophosphatase 1 [Eurytemora carolleeae]|uniref:inositol monophosphatase 1 n=1 Tax=Eurytemora carolleeae TaxID=1294199 RepID=UPI000C76469F|nr:inositol monophosphatase 1 [Eurytemora carolleeae]|eukprot:XP_023340872.1 inositol monophosphatase 1-like [Eurytemora affinis]